MEANLKTFDMPFPLSWNKKKILVTSNPEVMVQKFDGFTKGGKFREFRRARVSTIRTNGGEPQNIWYAISFVLKQEKILMTGNPEVNFKKLMDLQRRENSENFAAQKFRKLWEQMEAYLKTFEMPFPLSWNKKKY